MPEAPSTKLIPPALIKQAGARLNALAVASDGDTALGALYLLHCTLREMLEWVPVKEPLTAGTLNPAPRHETRETRMI